MVHDERLRTAAAWWADLFRKPVVHDNGVAEHSMLGTLVGLKAGKPTEEQIKTFEDHLYNALVAEAQRGRSYIYVDVDYHPGIFLQDAMDAAGMGDGFCRLPFKTSMWIDGGKVTVAKGYRAEMVTIYGGKEEDNGPF